MLSGDTAALATAHHEHSSDSAAAPLLPPDEKAGTAALRPLAKWALSCAVCTLCLMGTLWLTSFIIVCILLARANTPSVLRECAGFWDFMVVAVMAPFIIPFAYCLTAPCIGMQWRPFSGACMAVMSISALHLTLNAASNYQCVESIRSTSPPVPWLIIVGWFKAAVYGAGALSSLLQRR